MLTWQEPNRVTEATGDSDARRAQRAYRAAQDIAAEYERLEDATADQLVKRLNALRQSLLTRLGEQFLTDFRRYSLNSLLADVDRLIADTTKQITDDVRKPVERADSLGDNAGVLPIQAAGLRVTGAVAMPGLDLSLVNATFGNMVDLLTPNMQQFGGQVKTAIRRVALAGDSRMGEIKKLRDQISGAGFDGAAYKAERQIRTELGRTFNESTYGKLVELSKQFSFIRKCWRCTRDNRTRLGHVQAAIQYAKGKGIPISELFLLKVYDERNKARPKLIGTAQLRFPIDPMVTPEGRIGAAATILCRCNAYVDFNMVDFAAYTRQQVTLALGGPTAPPAAPALPPAQSAPKPRKQRAPKPVTPQALIGTPISKAADPAAIVPKGTVISSKVAIGTNVALRRIAADAFQVLDSVHGDGPLNQIPLNVERGRFFGMIQTYPGRGVTRMALSPNGVKDHPRMTLWHETGHWIDMMGLGKGNAAHSGQTETVRYIRRRKVVSEVVPVKVPPRDPGHAAVGEFTSKYKPGGPLGGINPLLAEWHQAVMGTPQVQAIQDYAKSYKQPRAVQKHAQYLLQDHELFARSYAQYIATRSGDAAGLQELNDLRAPAPGKHDLDSVHKQWSDKDFEPIGAAFDRLFERIGWRGKKT